MADVLRKFGRYFLLDHIAQGGMAEIFRARLAGKEGYGRIITIKRIQSAYGSNPEFVSMFKSEIKVTMGFNHPNIVQLYDFGEEDSQPYIAMEFVDGRNLRQFMNRFHELKQKFPVDLAAHIGEQVAAGLHYAHTFRDKVSGTPLEIVHRDISPQNVLISYEGGVKIIDFGIAKAASNTDSTRAGVIKGKPSYLAPEQISGEKLDGRSDVFALGIVLWELLVGKKLFAGESDLAVLKLIESCEGNIKPPSSFNPKVDPDLDAIVFKALAKRRDRRYQSAEELQRALRKYLQAKFPDFNPGDLAYHARDLFKNDIVEDRKRVQRLNDRAEKLLQEGESIEVESPRAPSAQAKPVETSGNTVVDPNMRFATSGSRDRLSLEGDASASLEIDQAALKSVGRGRASGGRISHVQVAKPSLLNDEAVGGGVQGRMPGQETGWIEPKTASLGFKSIAVAIGGFVALVLVAPQFGFRVPVVTSFVEGFLGQNHGVNVANVDPATPVLTSPGTVGANVARAPSSAVRTVLLQVNVQPRTGPDGEIRVNNQLVNWANPVIKVELDQPLEVKVQRAGYRVASRQFVLKSTEVGGRTAVPLDLQLQPMQYGYLYLKTTPSADALFTVDGQPWVRQTPIEDERLPVGTYTIRLKNELLGMEKQVTVSIQEGKKVRLEEHLNLKN